MRVDFMCRNRAQRPRLSAGRAVADYSNCHWQSISFRRNSTRAGQAAANAADVVDRLLARGDLAEVKRSVRAQSDGRPAFHRFASGPEALSVSGQLAVDVAVDLAADRAFQQLDPERDRTLDMDSIDRRTSSGTSKPEPINVAESSSRSNRSGRTSQRNRD